jgi:hypothetical protein
MRVAILGGLLPKQDDQQYNQENQTQTAGIISPPSAMRLSRQRDNHQQKQYQKQDKTHL